MLVCQVDPTALSAHESAALDRTTALLGRVDPQLPVGDGSWTARDVAAHVLTVVNRYLNPAVRLGQTAREVDEINQAELEELASTPMTEILGLLRDRAATYAEFWPLLPLDQRFPFHSGLQLDVAALRSNWIAELLIHGRDVAQAAGESWPLDGSVSLLFVRLVASVLPGYVRRADAPLGAFVIAADGGEPVTVNVTDEIEVSAGGTGGDGISGPAETVALLLYQRLSAEEAMQAGLRLEGDRDRVQRFLGALEAP